MQHGKKSWIFLNWYGSAYYATMVNKSSNHPFYCYDMKIYLAIISFSKSLFYLASQKKISLQQFSILT